MAQDRVPIADLYSGAFGPTLRLEVHSIAQLIVLKEIFTNLRAGSADEFKLSRWDGINISGFSDLVLRFKEQKGFFARVMNLQKFESVISWEQSGDAWWHCEGFVDGLIEGNQAGHHYLYEEIGMLTIELAFKP